MIDNKLMADTKYDNPRTLVSAICMYRSTLNIKRYKFPFT